MGLASPIGVGSDSATVLFCMLYGLFCTGFVCQFQDFVGLGLSPENVLTSIFRLDLGSEEMQFLDFQLRKSCGTFLLHLFLPIGFCLGFAYCHSIVDGHHGSMFEFWAYYPWFQWLVTLLVGAWLLVFMLTQYWTRNNFEKHPYIRTLTSYAREGNWSDLVKDINNEFRRVDKFSIRTNPMERVVVTDNWIIHLGGFPWQFHLAHQSDVSLKLIQSEHHNISTEGQAGGTQFIHIQVENQRPHMASFEFRLNSLEYQNLQGKLRSQIQNIQNIQIFKTVGDRFVEVFRQEVDLNPTVSVDEELESCIGCMSNEVNVKLVRRCDSIQPEANQANPCVNCYCRPMWCLDCLAKWFASRQNQQEPETWLGSKCPCPTCRSRFCILDVALIE